MNTPVSRLWSDLQQANKLPRGQVLRDCQGELQELMRQIDVMVQSRKCEWESERSALQAKLDVREREFTLQRSTLEHKHQEVGELRSQLDTMERTQQDTSHQYEEQLAQLKLEIMEQYVKLIKLRQALEESIGSKVDKMKKEYERLQKHYSRRERDTQRDNQRATSAADDSNAEVRRLTAKLDDYRKKSRDWERQKREYQKQIEGLESQRRTLSEKYDLIQTQSTTYQSQLDRRREMLDSTEMTLRTQVTQLETALDRSRDNNSQQEVQLGRLKTSLDEAVAGQRRALEDKEQSESELRKTHQTMRKFEEDLRSQQRAVEAKDEVLNAAAKDKQAVEKDLVKLEEVLQDKERAMVSLERQHTSHTTEQIHQIQEELDLAKDEVRKWRRMETHYSEEVGTLRQAIAKSQSEAAQARKDSIIKDSEIQKLLAEFKKLKADQSTSKDRHLGERDGMKTELTQLTTDLHQRHLVMASLTEQMANLERKTRDQDEEMERKRAELQVANAQLDALRVENRHLRRTGSTVEGVGDVEVMEAEHHLHELQGAYRASVETLEAQNDKLQADMTGLQVQLQEMETNTQSRIQSALRESQNTIASVQAQENQRIRDTQETSRAALSALEDRLNTTVTQYETQLEHLHLHCSQLEGQLDTKNTSVSRLGMENDAMHQFVDGVETIVQSPPHRPPSQPNSLTDSNYRLHRRNHSHGSSGLYGDSDEDDDMDILTDTADSATAKFLMEQDARTKQLELQLDHHIEDLRKATEATVRKYSTR